MKTQIGFYSDNTSLNLQSLLRTSKVQVRLVDGRTGIARATGAWDACWVNFDGDNGYELIWTRVNQEVAEITGLVCDKCEGVFVVKVLRQWCDGCRLQNARENAVRTFDSNRRRSLQRSKQ